MIESLNISKIQLINILINFRKLFQYTIFQSQAYYQVRLDYNNSPFNQVSYSYYSGYKMLDTLAKKLTKALPPNKIDLFGNDSLLFNAFPYYMLLFISIISNHLYLETGNSFLIIFILYSVIPLLDEFFSLDSKNPQGKQVHTLEQEGWKYDIPLYLTVIYDWWLFFAALGLYENFSMTPLGVIQILGFTFIVSNVNAAQFAVAHQLMHKPGFKRYVGTLHMLKTLNMHFTYEHVFGHHRKVATEEDPASAEKGQNAYNFFIRSYFGAYKSVYEMEKQAGKPFWRNYIILSICASLAFCVTIFHFYSLQTFALFMLQVLGAIFYLQVINYIEHYGLRRKKLLDNTYQKVTPKHSWNSPHRFSNYLFFKLQRHSDHHQNSMKPYQVLLTIDQAPQLPHGYIVMTVLALFPSEFMRIMDPLVDQYNKSADKRNSTLQELYNEAFEQTRIFVMKITICTVMLSMGLFALL